jgi:hypothetical protein
MAVRRILGLATTLIAFAVGVSSAQAATVTVGDPLTSPSYGVSGFSGGPYTIFNTKLISGQDPGSPVDGTVISWGVGSPNGGFALQILRATGAGTYFATDGTAQRQLRFDNAASPPQATSLPIDKGDLIALRTAGGTSLYQSSLGSSARIAPAVYPGESAVAATVTSTTDNYIYNATIRYCLVPQLTGKSLTTARSALLAADCSVGTITKPKKKKARKKAKVVRSTSLPAGASVSDTTPIDLSLGKKPKK